MRVRANVPVYIAGVYRRETEVFNYEGDKDPNLTPVDPGTPLGMPEPVRADPHGGHSIAGTPTPQIVFDIDPPSDGKPTHPSNLDMFA